MKKFLSLLFSRMVFVAIFFVAQIAAIAFCVFLMRGAAWYFPINIVLGIAFVVHILSGEKNPAYKIGWIIPIMIFPIFGCLLYFMFGSHTFSSRKKQEMRMLQGKYESAMHGCESYMGKLRYENTDAAIQAEYIQYATSTPVFEHTETKFLNIGEKMFEQMKIELKKAKKFIFMEFFIVEEGKMWNSILSILEEKVKEGVDVRFIYDDMGSIFTLPKNYDEILEKKGIKCCVFNRFIPVLSPKFNNRDHRKICVIDGNVGFTGGVNLADEYINARKRFGHWLDCGVMLKGEAVWSFTMMFLSMWDYVHGSRDDVSKFRPDPDYVMSVSNDGYVMPFTDTPVDDETVGETVYVNMINRAKKYVYICTPYLVLDQEIIASITTAAKSGIDIRIITPHIPDKKFVHTLSRSYYSTLIKAGVRIFEYLPGFCHSKSFVCDDEYGVVGSINLDFRSLYLHYECATWMYKSGAVLHMKQDYLENLNKCKEITLDWCRGIPWYTRIYGSLLRAFATLL